MVTIKNNPIKNTQETPSELKELIYKWLGRLNIPKSLIEIDYVRSEQWASIEFTYNQKNYTFKSNKQKTYKDNLKAIEIFLHNRVISIERGIEEIETAFSGYEQIAYQREKSNIYEHLTIQELKNLLKVHHPDMPSGNRNIYEKVKEVYDKKKNE